MEERACQMLQGADKIRTMHTGHYVDKFGRAENAYVSEVANWQIR
jgi:hypothetical protein